MKRIAAGILAHVDSGKTTLSEALLYRTGSISKLGRVDHGSSYLDTFSLERDRGITIFSKQAILKYKDTEFTLLDTPGHVDFSAETERTLQVLDYAVLVISATDGIQAHTVTLWNLLNKYSVPCFLFINKMDLDGAEKDRIIYQLKARLSDGCIDFENDGSEDFFESLALCDDGLLNEYEGSSCIKKESIITAIKNRKVFPCMFGSALKLSGIDEFLECFYTYSEMPNYSSEFGGRVFKIAEDPQGNRLTYLKVTGGTLKVKDVLKSDKNKNAEKVNQIRIYSGDKFSTADEAEAGTVCAVTGIS
ncbi:MAG: GTP-binding protein, partial [Eubacterium sp.]|nr:GTP-binding protein [Eubacterium sp.]